ncbi:MAG: leucyl aminopeptidase family protein, partial [Pseudomonadota bacterium]|nr:leucyl aminopeptidase family protein [Pseudomonadota bacterium]
MPHPLLASANDASKPVWLVTEQTWPSMAEGLPQTAQGFAKAQGFQGKAGSHCLLPDADGNLMGVAFGLNGADAKHTDPFLVGRLPTLLPEGVYRFETGAQNPTLATLAWLLGAYSFNRYRKRSEKSVRLVPPNGVDAEDVARIANAVMASRDLVNTPTSDL